MLYLYYGADELARTEAVREAKAAIPVDLVDLNVTMLDGRKLKLDALATACEAFPFLTDRRLVIVEDALKGLKAGGVRDAVKDYLPRVPETTDVIFVEREEIDKRSALFTYLKKAATVREFLPREGMDLQRWLHDRAKHLGIKLVPEAATLLIEYVGNDGRALLNELQKLAAYTGEQGLIGVEAVRLLVADSGESSVFAFVDALAARQLAAALGLLAELLADGEAPLKLLFMIGRQIRLLLQVKELMEQRMRPEAIASELKQSPFVVRKAVDQAQRFTGSALVQLHDRLLQLDHWLKTGRIEGETALELLVVETCHAVQAPGRASTRR